MSTNRSAHGYRIGTAVVFLLLTAVVVVPLSDAHQRTTLDRAFRIIGGVVLLGLAVLSLFAPSGRPDRN